MAMLCDIPIHDLAAGDFQLLGDSRNNSGASTSSGAHLKCNLRIKRGSRHLLLGKNGCGKTTLLHAIHNGTLSGWPQNVSRFLVDQELNLLDLEKNVLSAVLDTDTVTSSLRQRRDALEQCLEQEGDAPTIEKCSVELTGVYERLAGQEDETMLQHRAWEILTGLGFSRDMLDSPVRNLSGGWRVRAALAAALFMEPQLLLLDEPTNHLDVKAIVWLQRFLATTYTGEKTLICVSHDRSFINAILTEIIVIQDRSLTYFNGALDEFEAAAEEMATHMEHEAEALMKKRASAQKAVERMKAKDSRQFRKSHEAAEHNNFRTNPKSAIYAKNQKDTGQMRKLETKLHRVGMEKTLDGKKFKLSEHGERLGSFAANEGESTGRALAAAPLFQRSDPSLQFNFAEGGHLGLHASMPILQVKDASYAYPGDKSPTLIDVDLCIPADGRIAVAGCNGAGKSTLVNLLLGRLQPTAGEVWRHRNVKIAHLDQHEADQLQWMSCTALQYIQECFPDKKDLELRGLLGSFGVKGHLVQQSLNTLSGGQRVRVAFARICGGKPHLLILDEPTNHLDIYSIDALSEALQDFKGAVVLITHNCSMLNACAKELHVVESGACRAASCPVGVKLGDWLIQGQLIADAEGHIPNAVKNSGSKSVVNIPKKTLQSCDLQMQPANTPCMEELVEQSALTQILNVPTPARPLRATEKEFLRCCKRAREILKLEALQPVQNLDKAQARKLQTKEEAIEELVNYAMYLPGDSDLLEKNADIKQLLETQH
jgi:ATPase subunit of ABC transporter with duplicated ATPase domains